MELVWKPLVFLIGVALILFGALFMARTITGLPISALVTHVLAFIQRPFGEGR